MEALADTPMRVRIGLHTGRPLLGEEGYVGEDVHLGARIAASGHGGQVLLSDATRSHIGADIEVTDLGEHRLKDVDQPVAIHQLGRGSFPPLKTISNTNLPRPVDSFIGREVELAEIVSRLRDGSRLLTLIGPGGTGKTRLAIEAASTLVPDFKAGTFWVDLSPVRDPDAVAAAVGATLTAERDLADYIGEREMLLVLDNLEQVIDAAPWIGSLVTACANLRVLATSRERLRVRGESLLDVPPLRPQDSVRLFADRASLAPSTDMEELCRRLEHLPLATELAAARASTLSPRQILARLGERLDVLKGGRDADPRQRTLRATIDWSHELLDADEQRLFRRLSVFAGGATLEAIEAVCAGRIDTLESLVDKSLVRAVDERYSMFETVREYAADRLAASDERSTMQDRHATFVTELMSAKVPRLTSAGDEDVGELLRAEFPNLQAALAWLVESGDAHRATALIDTAWWFVGEWLSRSRDGLAMCEAVLAMPALTDADRATIHHREGNFAAQLSDLQRARDAWMEAAAIAHRLRDAPREASALHNVAITEADPVAALRLFERSLALAPPEDEAARIQVDWNVAGLKRRAGDVSAWESAMTEILARARRLGDFRFMASADEALADAALQRGDAAEAFERATRALELSTDHKHEMGIVIGQTIRCRAALRLGRTADAIASLAVQVDTIDRSDLGSDEEIAASVLYAAVEVLAAAGDLKRAAAIERARRPVAQARPWTSFGEEEHDAWLADRGLVVDDIPSTTDLPGALKLVREWLASLD